jgi:hypothetical protein
MLISDPEIIVYNIAYHMGILYEDIAFLAGIDVISDMQ